ncbi:MAG: FtsX-like permease family protein [Leptolyngbyaceae bacterium]|nr:FtsX-like permease family protein [Leptolyngbyaceae bacterium]
MVSIARKNLFEDIPRFLVAQAGIMFAVSLVTIQLGILHGFTRSTAQLIDNSGADLWVAAQEMVNFELTQPLTLEAVVTASGIEGVARAEALILSGGRWRSLDGKIGRVRIIGFNPTSQLFSPGEIVDGNQADIEAPFSVLTDVTNLSSLRLDGVGGTAEINSAPTTVVGLTQGTQSIVSSTTMFTSLENAKAYATAGLTSKVLCDVGGLNGLDCTTTYEQADPDDPIQQPQALTIADPITYVLIGAKANQDLDTLKERLEAAIPDVKVHTREEMATITRDYWRLRTGIGFILGLGATVGIIVGMVIVGQILYSSVSDHIREYGTLKAMGASDQMIYSIIVEQALWMAVLGYIPSMGLCLGLGAWTISTQGIMILITLPMGIGIFGITVLMCVGSALFAIQKVTHVDPAIVFKA